MTAKEYLSQAYRLDQRINSKIEQISSLNELATKCTAALNGMPGSSDHGKSTMSDAIIKIIELQEEINNDIDKLVDLKREIVRLIKAVEDSDLQTLLELRYLCFKTWEEIAVEMNYSNKWVRIKHSNALNAVAAEMKKRVPESSVEFQI